jgi:hypothetical protein
MQSYIYTIFLSWATGRKTSAASLCRQVHVIALTSNNLCHVASVTESCDCDCRFHAFALRHVSESLNWPQRSPYLPMDAPLDEASTSDANERELLEAAHSDSYWDRVVSRSHFKLKLLPPSTLSDQGDDM